MAGNYPDSPSWRLAIDKDGTTGFYISSANVITSVEAGGLTAITNDNETDGLATSLGANAYLALLFPVLMDIDAVYAVATIFGSAIAQYNRPVAIKTSVDTTNGVDGTWVSRSVGSAVAYTGKEAVRNDIVSSTWGGIKGVKFAGASSGGGYVYHTVHLYGEPTAGQSLDRLALWHPTLDQRVTPAYFDWGNVPRGSTADRTFRVKNLSAGLTAVTPRIAMDVLTDSSPSFIGQHFIGKSGTFLSQQNIASLSPGAISSEVLTLRRVMASNAQLSLWSMRVFAEANSWS